MDGGLFWGLLFFLWLPGLASADSVNSEWFSTAHALSMGNVGIANSDDPNTSTFYNPAGLAKNKKPSVEIFNPQMEVGSGVMGLNKNFTDYGKQSSLESLKPLLLAAPGKISSLGFSVFPSITSENFNLGVLYSVKTYSYYDKKSDSFIHHNRRLLVPTFGMAMPLLGGRIRLGVAGRGVQNYERDAQVKASSTSTITAVDNARAGFGVGIDAGILLTLPWAMLPTIGGVARNIGGVHYGSGLLMKVGPGTANVHEVSKATYDSGFSLSPKMGGKKDKMVIAFDYRDVLNVTGASFMRHYNGGIELNFGGMLSLRAGYGMGYWSAGLGLGGKKGGLEIGSYGEELTDKGYNAIEDRRYILKFTRRF